MQAAELGSYTGLCKTNTKETCLAGLDWGGIGNTEPSDCCTGSPAQGLAVTATGTAEDRGIFGGSSVFALFPPSRGRAAAAGSLFMQRLKEKMLLSELAALSKS